MVMRRQQLWKLWWEVVVLQQQQRVEGLVGGGGAAQQQVEGRQVLQQWSETAVHLEGRVLLQQQEGWCAASWAGWRGGARPDMPSWHRRLPAADLGRQSSWAPVGS